MNSMQGCIEVNMQQMVQHFNFLKYRTGSCFFGMKNAVFVFLSNILIMINSICLQCEVIICAQ